MSDQHPNTSPQMPAVLESVIVKILLREVDALLGDVLFADLDAAEQMEFLALRTEAEKLRAKVPEAAS